MKAKEIIDAIDPDKFQCHKCKRYLIRDLLISTFVPSTLVAGFECVDALACRWWKDDRQIKWYHAHIDTKPPVDKIGSV